MWWYLLRSFQELLSQMAYKQHQILFDQKYVYNLKETALQALVRKAEEGHRGTLLLMIGEKNLLIWSNTGL